MAKICVFVARSSIANDLSDISVTIPYWDMDSSDTRRYKARLKTIEELSRDSKLAVTERSLIEVLGIDPDVILNLGAEVDVRRYSLITKDDRSIPLYKIYDGPGEDYLTSMMLELL